MVKPTIDYFILACNGLPIEILLKVIDATVFDMPIFGIYRMLSKYPDLDKLIYDEFVYSRLCGEILETKAEIILEENILNKLEYFEKHLTKEKLKQLLDSIEPYEKFLNTSKSINRFFQVCFDLPEDIIAEILKYTFHQFSSMHYAVELICHETTSILLGLSRDVADQIMIYVVDRLYKAPDFFRLIKEKDNETKYLLFQRFLEHDYYGLADDQYDDGDKDILYDGQCY